MQDTAKTLMIIILIIVGGVVIYSLGGDTVKDLIAKYQAENKEQTQEEGEQTEEEQKQEDEERTSPRNSLVSSRTSDDKAATSTKESVTKTDQSEYYSLVDLSTASAKQKDPQKEYITLTNKSKTKEITITGWTLKNGKDQRLYQIGGGGTVRGSSDFVTIPTAVKDVNVITAFNAEVPVTLKPGEKAIILTGAFPQNPVLNTSFKTNMCIGYLAPTNSVYPSVPKSCPATEAFGEYSHFEASCYTYIDKIGRCVTPKIDEGQALLALTPSCRDYIRERYNYTGCVKQFKNTTGFEGKEWRIFLNRPSELWADTREVITLIDNTGKVVDKVSY